MICPLNTFEPLRIDITVHPPVHLAVWCPALLDCSDRYQQGHLY
jgi:hypothetical protein